MKKSLIASVIAVAGVISISTSAFACPNGYKRVWIQGNPVCQLDASASNSLKAPGHPGKKVVAQPSQTLAR
jgi:hypothetical protein